MKKQTPEESAIDHHKIQTVQRMVKFFSPDLNHYEQLSMTVTRYELVLERLYEEFIRPMMKNPTMIPSSLDTLDDEQILKLLKDWDKRAVPKSNVPISIDQLTSGALRHLVDVVWNHVTESNAVPSTVIADELIKKSIGEMPSKQIDIKPDLVYYDTTSGLIWPGSTLLDLVKSHNPPKENEFCKDYSKDKLKLGESADCDTVGHYLCSECSYKNNKDEK